MNFINFSYLFTYLKSYFGSKEWKRLTALCIILRKPRQTAKLLNEFLLKASQEIISNSNEYHNSRVQTYITKTDGIFFMCFTFVKQFNYPMSVLKCQLRTKQMTLTLHAIYFPWRLQNSSHIPKGTVQKLLLETDRNSTTHLHFKANYC